VRKQSRQHHQMAELPSEVRTKAYWHLMKPVGMGRFCYLTVASSIIASSG
jgi:ABC-type cobalamin transport system ATPase subunit